MLEYLDLGRFASIGTIVIIDIVLSGDNAIVIGMAVAGLPEPMRRKAIVMGIAAATLLRVIFALITVQLLSITGLTFIGGLLLLWVCWRMWQEIRRPHLSAPAAAGGHPSAPSLRQALTLIVIADVSMSLDNVLAVAGAARGEVPILIFGLALSIALMAVAATFIAKLMQRHPWIAYVGLVVLLGVAVDMTWRGGGEVIARIGAL